MSARERKEIITPREIKFYGEGVASLIKDGIKLGTLRMPKDYYEGFSQGEEFTAVCQDDQEQIPAVILASFQKPLGEIDPALLALGGFLSCQEALEEMPQYYPDQKISPLTPMRYFVFIGQEKLETFPKPVQDLLRSDFGTCPEEYIRDGRLRQVFFPSICQWLIWKEKADSWLWLNSLVNRFGLISAKEDRKVKFTPVILQNEGPYFLINIFDTPGLLQKVLDSDRDSELYKSLILAKTLNLSPLNLASFSI